MTIKRKFFVFAGIPVLSLVIVSALGWWALSGVTTGFGRVVDEELFALLDEDIMPLIDDDMLPLVNDDLENLTKLEEAITLMLEADRDAHQALIAEMLALAAEDEKAFSSADESNSENIGQAARRMKKAAANFNDEASKNLYAEFIPAFASWQETSRRVISLAANEATRQEAAQLSNGGEATAAFDNMRDMIDRLQGLQMKEIEATLAVIDQKKERANKSRERVVANKTTAASDAGQLHDQARSMTTLFVAIGLAVVIIVPIVGFVLARSIIGPIQGTVRMLEDIADGEGDLTKRLDDTKRDELGELARAFNRFVGKLRGIIQDIAGNAQTLAGSSTELAATATQLASGAENMTQRSTTVSAAAEEMSSNMNNMAAAAEQMTANMRSVAAAVEEMTTSISDVARNAEQSADVAQQATNLVQASNSNIGQLGEAADAIGKVIETIQDIAEQTNLLALNATIEAARAGDAGKGFAVVATEVKELAKQTALATEDIRSRIEGIQSSTGSAVSSIGEVNDVIEKVNEVSRSIASSVNEQSQTTKEIAATITQTATAADTVAVGVTQSAAASGEITANISSVDDAAKQSAHGANQTHVASDELSKLSEQLAQLVGQFKT